MTAIFAVFSLIMVPFAYLKALYTKVRILACYKPKSDKKSRKNVYAKDKSVSDKVKKRKNTEQGADLVIFLVFGLPMLIISWALDTYHFIEHIYRSDIKNYGSAADNSDVMTEEQFIKLEAFCQHEFRKHINRF